jgi:hypothetical protein
MSRVHGRATAPSLPFRSEMPGPQLPGRTGRLRAARALRRREVLHDHGGITPVVAPVLNEQVPIDVTLPPWPRKPGLDSPSVGDRLPVRFLTGKSVGGAGPGIFRVLQVRNHVDLLGLTSRWVTSRLMSRQPGCDKQTWVRCQLPFRVDVV